MQKKCSRSAYNDKPGLENPRFFMDLRMNLMEMMFMSWLSSFFSSWDVFGSAPGQIGKPFNASDATLCDFLVGLEIRLARLVPLAAKTLLKTILRPTPTYQNSIFFFWMPSLDCKKGLVRLATKFDSRVVAKSGNWWKVSPDSKFWSPCVCQPWHRFRPRTSRCCLRISEFSVCHSSLDPRLDRLGFAFPQEGQKIKPRLGSGEVRL